MPFQAAATWTEPCPTDVSQHLAGATTPGLLPDPRPEALELEGWRKGLRCLHGWARDLREGSQFQIKEAAHGSDRKWLMAPGTARAMQGQRSLFTLWCRQGM